MNIGQLLERMEEINDWDAKIFHVSREFCSYRGYYEHLAMARSEGRVMSIVEFFNVLHDQVGKTYTGYKGGKFTMHLGSELFVADYSRLGQWVVGICKVGDDHYELATSGTDFNGF